MAARGTFINEVTQLLTTTTTTMGYVISNIAHWFCMKVHQLRRAELQLEAIPTCQRRQVSKKTVNGKLLLHRGQSRDVTEYITV